jgi:hypothetical protein
MTRWWNELVASITDVIPVGLAYLLVLLLAGIVGIALYWLPAWLPWRWWRTPRLRLRLPRIRWRWPWHWQWSVPWRRWRLRWPWRRRPRPAAEPTLATPVAGDGLPDLPVADFVSLADRLAAEGRFAEAVRERLRAIVRELIDAGLIDNSPGWTVTELAAAAGAARPAVRPGLDAASRLFSDIWYGQRPASADDDRWMRGYAGQVHDALTGVLVGSSR